MNVVDKRATRKDNNKNKTTTIIYDQNSHQIKTKTKRFYLFFIKKDIGSVSNATGQQVDKKSK